MDEHILGCRMISYKSQIRFEIAEWNKENATKPKLHAERFS